MKYKSKICKSTSARNHHQLPALLFLWHAHCMHAACMNQVETATVFLVYDELFMTYARRNYPAGQS